MKVIYGPKGRALEYAPLAVNLYRGCGHGCEYCYAPAALRMKKETFFNEPEPRKNIIPQLMNDAEEMSRNKDNREVLMCFSCDPYQEIDIQYQFTKRVIKIFNENEIHYSILTKGGKRSERDFYLLAARPDLCRYGVTLVFRGDGDSKIYEPGAAPTSERIETLQKAHELGIRTWVSLEPVWSPEDAYKLIYEVHDFVDEIRIGKLNYHPHAKEVDWKLFKEGVEEFCKAWDVNYILKNDLAVL